MEPINKSQPGCNPTSSNCVIWNGPNIACIDLCNGDSISDVTYKLATELCDIIDQLSVDTYDLSCLTLCPTPENFHDLVQVLIQKICDLQTCCDTPTPIPTTGCPDCVVSIAPCFYYVNPQGDTVTTMQLQDYLTAVGNRICSMLSTQGTQGGTLINHGERITALEDTPPPAYTPPDITPFCVSTAAPTDPFDVLISLEQQFCELRSSTGLPNDIYSAIGKQCTGLSTDLKLAPGGGIMGSIPGWLNTEQSFADSFSNMWLTICDLRSAVKNIKLNCCPGGCDSVLMNLQATLTGSTTLKLFFTGTIPTGFVQCVTDTMVTVTDADGASITFGVNVQATFNDPAGYTVNISGTPLNPATDFTITANTCFKSDTLGATCSNYLQFVLANTLSCPSPVSLMPGSTSIDFSFQHISGSVTYVVELYDAAGTTLIASQSIPATATTVISGSFFGLSGSTNFKLRVRVTAGGASTNCPFQAVSTQPDTCPAPTSVTSNITIP